MVIETLIDLKDLTKNQSLIIRDEQGRRWDVEEALNSSPESSEDGEAPSNAEVIVERWIVQLNEPPSDMPQDIAPVLPRTYKNSIVLFRSLYTCARLLPAWTLGKKLFSPRPSHALPKLKFRISDGQDLDIRTKADRLSMPLYVGHENVCESFVFGSIDSPAGAISIRAMYRSNCDFRIENSEEVLSSRFMGMDERAFEPSLGRRQDNQRTPGHQRTASAEMGSFPSRVRDETARPDIGQAYGSMSTFHQVGPQISTSPMSALRAAQVAGSQSPEDNAARKLPPGNRSGQGSRSSLRSADGGQGVGRRPSVSFMPFKAPALSASPSQTEQAASSIPKSSLGKNSPLAVLAEARHPSHLAPHSRTPPSVSEATVASPNPDSVRPPATSRFSSSFGHRKGKLSAGGGSKTEDETSSGKASVASSNAQPGSGVLAEGDTSSGSLQTDDDNISDFLKLLDQRKDLRSFRSASDNSGTDQSNRRTSAALSKYQRMKDSNVALSESLSSSLVLQRSSTSSSQRISSVPAMVAGTSMSVSTSPGKPISPHTPHTPAIPSRLSANSIIEYSTQQPTIGEMDERQEAQDSENAGRDPNTGAIDIPNSPRPYHPSYRRSSSVAQRRAAPIEDEDLVPFGMRSASLGADDDRPQLSLSALANYPSGARQPDAEQPAPFSAEPHDSADGPMFDTTETDSGRGRQGSSGSREEPPAMRHRGGPYRPRIGRGSGRGDTPPQDSSSSLAERTSASGGSDTQRGGGRYSGSRPASNFEEEEPLFFAMSDFGAAQQAPSSRRSLDEARGGGDSGASSRRGSRPGGY